MYSMSNWRFLLSWIPAIMFAIVAGLGISLVLGLIIPPLIAVLLHPLPLDVIQVVSSAGAVLLIGVTLGLIVGIPQKNVLRRRFGREFTGWLLATVIGCILGVLAAGVVGGLIAQHVTAGYYRNLTTTLELRRLLFYGAFVCALPLLSVSLAQTVVLGRYVRSAWLWVLANVVSGVVLVSLVLTVAPMGGPLLFFPLALLMAAAPGIITSVTLLALFTWQRR